MSETIKSLLLDASSTSLSRKKLNCNDQTTNLTYPVKGNLGEFVSLHFLFRFDSLAHVLF